MKDKRITRYEISDNGCLVVIAVLAFLYAIIHLLVTQ